MADKVEETGQPAEEPLQVADDWTPPTQEEIDQTMLTQEPGEKKPGEEPGGEPKGEESAAEKFEFQGKTYTPEELNEAFEAKGQLDEKLKNLESGFTEKFQDLARDRDHVALMQKDLEMKLGSLGEGKPKGAPGNWEQKLLDAGTEPDDPAVEAARRHDTLETTIGKLNDRLDQQENAATLAAQSRSDDTLIANFESQVKTLCSESTIPEKFHGRIQKILANDDRASGVLANTTQLFNELVKEFITPLQDGANEALVKNAQNSPGGKGFTGDPTRHTPPKKKADETEEEDPFDEASIQREIRDRTADMPEFAHLHNRR